MLLLVTSVIFDPEEYGSIDNANNDRENIWTLIFTYICLKDNFEAVKVLRIAQNIQPFKNTIFGVKCNSDSGFEYVHTTKMRD